MRKIIPIILIVVAVMVSCTTLDCPLNNTVYAKYKLKGSIAKLSDTLTISTTRLAGSDSVLINKDVNIDSFILPMSYTQPEDVFFFEMRDTVLHEVFKDTVKVKKEDQPHFESVDCKPSYFHTITSIETTHNRIDSIVINHKEVNYDATKTHFYIYFGERTE